MATNGRPSVLVSNAKQAQAWLASISEMDIIADTEGVFVTSGSAGIGLPEWALAAETIRREYHRADGFVIVHQFETVPAAAWALSLMVQQTGKPVVICGSPTTLHLRTRSPRTASTGLPVVGGLGAKANYINALQVAVSDVGEVLVVHGSHMYRGSTLVGPMSEPQGLILGKIDFGIRFFGQQVSRTARPPKILSDFDTHIAVAEYLPGVDVRHMATVNKGTRALFLSSPEGLDLVLPFLASIRQALPANTELILYGPHHGQLPSFVIPVTAPARSAAVVKVMWALGQSSAARSLRKLLST